MSSARALVPRRHDTDCADVGPFRRPKPLEAFAWGSQSTSRVLISAAASEAPRLMAVVVFPTPPFWLAMAITRLKGFEGILVFPGRLAKRVSSSRMLGGIQIQSAKFNLACGAACIVFHVKHSGGNSSRGVDPTFRTPFHKLTNICYQQDPGENSSGGADGAPVCPGA
jgi:hypothetical protein